MFYYNYDINLIIIHTIKNTMKQNCSQIMFSSWFIIKLDIIYYPLVQSTFNSNTNSTSYNLTYLWFSSTQIHLQVDNI